MRTLSAGWILLLMMNSCSLHVQPLSPISSPSPSSVKTRIHQPSELHDEIKSTLITTSLTPPTLWNTVLPRRFSPISAEEGFWIANYIHDDLHCVAQVIPPGNVNLFHRDQEHISEEAIRGILHATVRTLLEGELKDDDSSSAGRLVLKFSALDRKLLPYVKAILEEEHIEQQKFSSIYTGQCGMWVYEETSTNYLSLAEFNKDLPKGVSIRPLCQENAQLINERWEYRSDSSLTMIRKMIQISEDAFGGCVGLFVDNRLVSWICRYLNGTLGMLFTESEFRKKGYARLVVAAAVSDCYQKMAQRDGSMPTRTADGRMVSYIVDSNGASQRLYQKLGWKRVADADWVGFASRKRSK
eukprot:CAMPEP_0181080420 /NCGR_PEP_ID=MMETSP1071-20121207/2558_1 /TAXON_ID=35127 /ORGANISM="Thalassiosira sp., Strain NH16" /LENGTH=355 /DNA_ID=CAMNT_0023161897 /DNA_START=55 /DNA_END=1119 /DNA_ORIENTATION=-